MDGGVGEGEGVGEGRDGRRDEGVGEDGDEGHETAGQDE